MGLILLLDSLVDLVLQQVMDEQMARIADDLGNELVLKAQAIKEICFGEDGILHVLERWVLEEQAFEHFLFDWSNNEEVDFAFCLSKGTGEEDELHAAELLEGLDERALGLDVLTEDTLELLIERELRINVVVLLAIAMTRLHQTNAAEVFELATNGVDLFPKQTCEFTNEKLLLRM